MELARGMGTSPVPIRMAVAAAGRQRSGIGRNGDGVGGTAGVDWADDVGGVAGAGAAVVGAGVGAGRAGAGAVGAAGRAGRWVARRTASASDGASTS
jgi:hypothetical protein